MLFHASDLRQLEGVRLNPRKSFVGRVRGERTTTQKGISIEFADYRDYAEGDDLRHLDWNILARLDSPVMKTYRDEEDLAVYLLVDQSESMRFGNPTKAETALRLAIALGYIGLASGDAVFTLSIGVRGPARAPFRGVSAFTKLMRWQPETPTVALTEGIRWFAASSARAGLVILCSDGMDADILPSLRQLASRGHEIFFVQVLSDLEIDPDIEGDVRLVDSENSRTVEITANGVALKEYKSRLQNHNQSIEDAVRKLGGKHTIVRNDSELRDVVRDVWRRQGWIA